MKHKRIVTPRTVVQPYLMQKLEWSSSKQAYASAAYMICQIVVQRKRGMNSHPENKGQKGTRGQQREQLRTEPER